MKYFWLLMAWWSVPFFTLSGQNRHPFSLEAGLAYSYPVMGGETVNDFNYGFSLMFFKTVSSVKIGFGLDLSTKNYHFQTVPDAFNGQMIKQSHRILYLDIPFWVSMRINRPGNVGISLLGGLVVNEMIRYHRTFYYAGNPPVDKIIPVPSAPGLSFRLGTEFSVRTSQRWQLNIVPFTDFKVIMNSVEESPHGDDQSIPDNRITPGLKVGMAYRF